MSPTRATLRSSTAFVVAVDDEVDLGCRHAGGFERMEDARGLVAGAGRDLGEADARPLRSHLMEEEVGEGPADVDPRNPPHDAPVEATTGGRPIVRTRRIRTLPSKRKGALLVASDGPWWGGLHRGLAQ